MRYLGFFGLALVAATITAPTLAYAQAGNTSATATTPTVQLRDEPGRTPFQQSVENSTCEEAPSCQVAFRSVPAGTRLVITHFNAAASITSVAPQPFVFSTLSGAGNAVVNTFLHTVPAPGISFANDETLMYFDAGKTPVCVVTDPAGLLDIRVTISGYLVRLQ